MNELIIDNFAGGVVGSDLNDPVGTVTSIDHHSLVTSNLVKMRGDNIGQPDTDPLHTISAQGLTLTKTAQVRMVGNSVCPPLSRALVEANFKHEQMAEKRA